ncbi:hypothetical protein [Saccharopolyspora sp. CA-218241]|uniref:RraA family protein n=1 Tax=Saccharopolyspora sp. CA-218241 TaxID=3240027 RepID=UPI003D992B25
MRRPAAIVDGAVRDVAALSAQGMVIFARAVTPAGPFKNGPGTVGAPVAVGGHESLYRDIMRPQHDLGLTDAIAGTFRLLQNQLADLAARPGPATAALAERLQRGATGHRDPSEPFGGTPCRTLSMDLNVPQESTDFPGVRELLLPHPVAPWANQQCVRPDPEFTRHARRAAREPGRGAECRHDFHRWIGLFGRC